MHNFMSSALDKSLAHETFYFLKEILRYKKSVFIGISSKQNWRMDFYSWRESFFILTDHKIERKNITLGTIWAA